MHPLLIRPATFADAEAICAIYNPYVLNSSISFEEQPVSPEQMAKRIGDVSDMLLPWLVICENGQLLGYAYATRWRARAAYRHAVETSIYLALLHDLQVRVLHTAIAGIVQSNPASNALHGSLGFRQVACFDEVGRKLDQWLDVTYWQLTLVEIPPLHRETHDNQHQIACQ